VSLLTRLIAPTSTEERIPIHAFSAAIGEFQRGAVTAAQVKGTFNMTTQEGDDLVAWYTAEVLSGNIDRIMLHDVLMLGETGHYTLAQVKARLNL